MTVGHGVGVVSSHPDRSRLVKVVAWGPEGRQTRGSGYLVGNNCVLTAQHVVAQAESVAVWVGAPSSIANGSGTTIDPARIITSARADIAFLPLPAGAAHAAQPVVFGQVPADPSPEPAAAAGWPLFKLRLTELSHGTAIRDLDVASGSIIGMANSETGTLAFSVDSPPREGASVERSPWEGMSGAAVWVGARLIGVVGKHYPSESATVLTVRPIAALFAVETPGWLAAARLVATQLPVDVKGLVTVRSAMQRALLEADANNAAQDLAPEALVARDEEISDLLRFARSAERWRWICAPAFSGKTALLAWLASHAPPDLAIVAVFLQRTTGFASERHALDTLIRQLALHAGEKEEAVKTDDNLRRQRKRLHQLLREAAAACRQVGHTLLLIVDGLDEYEFGLGLEGKLAWIPDEHTLPAGAKAVVSSREGVPIHLAAGHPLRGHRCPLTPSIAAQEVEELAVAELGFALSARGDLVWEVLGLLTAANTGLTVKEIAELLRLEEGRPIIRQAQINDVLRGPLSRTIRQISDRDAPDEWLEVFAHDVLRMRAQESFRSDLADFYALLDRWADKYEGLGWPAETSPQFLLRRYIRTLISPPAVGGRLVEEQPEPAVRQRLVRLLTNAERSELLFERYLNETELWEQLDDTFRLCLARQPADPRAAVAVATHVQAQRNRTRAIPRTLLVALVELGRPDSAIRLWQSLEDRGSAYTLLAALAKAYPDRAEELLQSLLPTLQAIAGPEDVLNLSIAMAKARQQQRLLGEHEFSRLCDSAQQLADLPSAVRVLTTICTQLELDHDQLDHVQQLIVMRAGDTDPAEAPGILARSASALRNRHPMLSSTLFDLAFDTAAAVVGIASKLTAALELSDAVEKTEHDRLRGLCEPFWSVETADRDLLPGLLAVCAISHPQRALRIAGGLPPERRYACLSEMSAVLAECSPLHALSAIEAIPWGALTNARGYDEKKLTLQQAIEAVAPMDYRAAVAAAYRIPDTYVQTNALVRASIGAARSNPDEAVRLMRGLTYDVPTTKELELGRLALAIAPSDFSLAVEVGQEIVADRLERASTFTSLASMVSSADPARAGRLLDEAAAAAGSADPGGGFNSAKRRAGTLASIAIAQQPLDPSKAAALLTEAQRVSHLGDETRDWRADAVWAVLEAMSRSNAAGALAALLRLPTSLASERALALLIQRNGAPSPEEAQRLALAITNDMYRLGALSALVERNVGTRPAMAAQLMDGERGVRRTLASAELSSWSWVSRRQVVDAIATYATTDLGGATRCLRVIRDPATRCETAIAIADALPDHGRRRSGGWTRWLGRSWISARWRLYDEAFDAASTSSEWLTTMLELLRRPLANRQREEVVSHLLTAVPGLNAYWRTRVLASMAALTANADPRRADGFRRSAFSPEAVFHDREDGTIAVVIMASQHSELFPDETLKLLLIAVRRCLEEDTDPVVRWSRIDSLSEAAAHIDADAALAIAAHAPDDGGPATLLRIAAKLARRDPDRAASVIADLDIRSRPHLPYIDFGDMASVLPAWAENALETYSWATHDLYSGTRIAAGLMRARPASGLRHLSRMAEIWDGLEDPRQQHGSILQAIVDALTRGFADGLFENDDLAAHAEDLANRLNMTLLRSDMWLASFPLLACYCPESLSEALAQLGKLS